MTQTTPEQQTKPSWGFLTSHALALVFLGRHPDITGFELALAIGITERATRRILVDLLDGGYVEREKLGRRNRYSVDFHRPLVRVGEKELTAGQLLKLVGERGLH